MHQKERIQSFTPKLLAWHAAHPRPLPWKDTTDPYLIWLSEIILQQTRVAQGTPYFERFRDAYPTVHDLADAPEDEVLKLWEGLGYYSRARNLHATARFISRERDGIFPDTYEEILQLKGVGPYTAAAIASFAFNLPHAVVDGNVYRVLARFFGIDTPVNSTAAKKEFTTLANELIPTDQPGTFNQAIMNFGALQCVPVSPDCSRCPLREACVAHNTNRVGQLPVKAKAKARRNRYFHFLVLRDAQKRTLLEKRSEKDIWRGLYQFPLLETNQADLSESEFLEQARAVNLPVPAVPAHIQPSPPYRQTLSHQNIHAHFWEVDCETMPDSPKNAFHLVARSGLSNFAFPRIIDWYLGDKTLYLDLR